MHYSRKKHLQNSVHYLLSNHDNSQLNTELHETATRATLQQYDWCYHSMQLTDSNSATHTLNRVRNVMSKTY